MSLFTIFNVFFNIISTFFQHGIWIVGFFFLLLKTFEEERLKQLSKYVLATVLALLLGYSVMISM
jgi:hypothetical protein